MGEAQGEYITHKLVKRLAETREAAKRRAAEEEAKLIDVFRNRLKEIKDKRIQLEIDLDKEQHYIKVSLHSKLREANENRDTIHKMIEIERIKR